MARADETRSCSNGLLFLPEQDREVRCYVLKSTGSKTVHHQRKDIVERTTGGEPRLKRIENDSVGRNKSRRVCNFL
jgi:hypothetical protein